MADDLTFFSVKIFENDFNSNSVRNPQLIEAIQNQEKTLLSVVEALGPVLTNKDKDIRKRGVEFLSWIVSQLSSSYLSEKEVIFISKFYSDRLKDHHSVIPSALRGILSLMAMKNMPGTSAKDLLFNIFQFVTCQSQVAGDRNILYRILQTSSECHLSSVQALGPDFMFGVIASMEGETDPQNLLLLFTFLPSLLSRLQIDHLTMDIFEVFSIYFPVDFSTVQKDDVVITREDLSEGLSSCLTATRKLAMECLPLILEKLDSTLKTAKLDSYKLLQRCCDRFSRNDIDSYLLPLWKMLQRDLLPALDPDIQREGLLALSSIIGALNSTEDVLQRFLDDVIVAVRSLVSKPCDSLFTPAFKILEALCPQSTSAARRALLEVEALCRRENHSEADLQVLLPATLPFVAFINNEKDVLTALSVLNRKTIEHTNNDDLLVACLKTFQKQVPEAGSDKEWRDGAFEALHIAIRKQKNENTLCESCKLISLLAKSYPQETLLKGYEEIEKGFSNKTLSIETFLEVSAAIADVDELSAHVLKIYAELGTDIRWPALALQSLLKACGKSPKSFPPKLNHIVMKFVGAWNSSTEIKIVRPLSHLLKEVLACRSAAEQTTFLAGEKCQQLLEAPLQGYVPLLVEGLVGPLWPEVLQFNEDRLQILVAAGLKSKEPLVRESIGRTLASIANKSSVYMWLLESLAQKIQESEEGAVSLYCWTLKGALLRGHPHVEKWIQLWFELLDGPASNHVAMNTKILLEADEVFLNESCHCTVRYLYRQRLFTYVPTLAQKLPSLTGNKDVLNNYLVTLLALSRSVPQEVIKSELDSIAFVVRQAMESTDTKVVENALELLKTLLQEKSNLFLDHTKTILQTLMALAVPPSTLAVRQTALQCVFLTAFYPTERLLPFRIDVIRGLVTCLDDHKRIVRAEASKARARWYMVGAPGEDTMFP